MAHKTGLHTTESVSGGHPDKICDQISDAILDACLAQDPQARVAVETAIKGDLLCLMGEVTTAAQVDHEAIARAVLRDIGHDGRWGLDPDRLRIITQISQQAPEIAAGVGGDETGAGDQGMVFGHAWDETPEFLPLGVVLANRLMRAHAALRSKHPLLGPDAKTQLTMDLDYGRPPELRTVVLSAQHAPDLGLAQLRELLREELLGPVLGQHLRPDTQVLINPAGSFHMGGPVADAGLTGRKLIVDTYGGHGRHGGGAFSGKDGTKTDRSAAYAARQLARDVVARGWAHECEVRIAYAIGQAEPVAIDFDHDGDPWVTLELRYAALGIDLRALLKPAAIIDRLGLRRPIFRDTATFGHFGVEGRSWEQPIEVSAIDLEAARRVRIEEELRNSVPVINYSIDADPETFRDDGRTPPELAFPEATAAQKRDLAMLRRLMEFDASGPLGLPRRMAWIDLQRRYPVCARIIAAELDGRRTEDARRAAERREKARQQHLETQP